MISGWQPDVVFFVLGPRQAEDAWAAAKYLQRRMLLVPLNDSVARHLPLASLSWLRVLNLVPKWLAFIEREIFFARALALIKRLTRRPPFPIFVFSCDVNVLEHTLIQFVRYRRASSVLIQDGFVDHRDAQWIVLGSRPFTRVALWLSKRIGFGFSFNLAYGAGGCDLIAAYGYQTREVLIERGVQPETITVTGSPRFDELVSTAAPHRQASTDMPVILAFGLMFSFQRWDTATTDDRWLEALNELSLKKPEWKIVLRPHPTEPLELYEKKLADFAETALVLDRTMPIREALQSSQAVIVSFPSTGVLEANLLGVPVVFLDLNLAIQQNDFVAERGAVTVSGPEDLVQTLEEVTNPSWQTDQRADERKEFLNRFLGCQDGRSAQRIARLIGSACETPPPLPEK